MVFALHPKARVFGPQDAGQAMDFAPNLPDRPGPVVLLAALAGQGAGFRIGSQGAVEAGPGQFETLTGGSLGAPRHILREQASWQASFALNARLFQIGPGRGVAVLGRLSHSLALYGAMEGAVLGADVHILDGLRPDRQWQQIIARRVSVLYATPAQLRLCLEGGAPSPDLRHVLVGGAKLDTDLRASLGASAPGAAVHEFYGAAETSFLTLAQAGDDPDSVGRPYPGVSLQIRVNGKPVADGETGEVWAQSPYLFVGYAGGDPGGAIWHDGWLSVGEQGYFKDGCLYLRGRTGRMVTVADKNVFPEEIEAFLLTLPGVVRAAVLPRADALRGAHLVAFLAGDPSRGDDVQRLARDRLGPLIAPRTCVWRTDWPLLPSGKTDFATLLREVAEWP